MKKNHKMMRQNQVRIIGGALRGRKITFPDSLGLRPTPDRVKETLFNWLSPVIRGSHCLDLFAGSGALSFEAISRGAERVVALEKASNVSRAIQEQANEMKIMNLEIKNIDSQIFLKEKSNSNEGSHPFDIVFVDPPYGSNLLIPSLTLLNERAWLKQKSLIYCGTDQPIIDKDLPSNWGIIRQQKAGVVYFYLIEVVQTH